jgi:hypothetical protein
MSGPGSTHTNLNDFLMTAVSCIRSDTRNFSQVTEFWLNRPGLAVKRLHTNATYLGKRPPYHINILKQCTCAMGLVCVDVQQIREPS